MRMQIQLVSILLFVHTYSNSQQYPVVHYTPKDGLVNSRVRDVDQDSKGHIYIMTFSGLSVYNGTRFTNYTTNNGLITDLVNDVLEITPDSILIATNACGLNALVHGKLISVPIEGKECPIVNQFLKTPQGEIYTTTDDGLYELKGNQFIEYSKTAPGIASPDFLGNIVNKEPYLLFCSNELRRYKGLFLFDKRKKELIGSIPGEVFSNLRVDYNGLVWVSHNGRLKNLDSLSLKNGKLELRLPYRDPSLAAEFTVLGFDFDQRQKLVLLANQGIVQYEHDLEPQLIYTRELDGLNILRVYIDRENTLWICTDGNGIYKIANTSLRFDVPFSKNNPSSVMFVTDSNVDSTFVISNDSKIALVSGKTEESFSYSGNFDVRFLYQHGRNIYAAEYHTLYYSSLPQPKVHHFNFKPLLVLPDTNSFTGRLRSDPFGQMIIPDREKLHVFHADQEIFSTPVHNSDLAEALLFDSNNKLCVVYRGIGLVWYSLHPDQPDRYLQKEDEFIRELEGASPRCAAIDSTDVIWVGTRVHGLLGYTYQDKKLQKKYQFQVQDGLTDNFVTALYIDAHHQIFVGTQTGLDKLIPTEKGFRIENITKRHNIFSFINQIWQDRDNHVFALTNSGRVFEIAPELDEPLPFEPKLLIEQIHVNDSLVSLDQKFWRFNHTQRNISVRVAAPTFLDETQVVYRYQLNSVGSARWSQPIHGGEINLFNLAHGKYTLQIKAEFPGTTYSDQATDFHFEILPPWWQRIWFRLVLSAALVFVAFLLVREYYRRKLEKQKLLTEKLQAIEKERTRIATDMHDDLGSGLSRIRFLGETISWKNKTGDPIDQDIAKIKSYSHEMIDKMGEIVWALNEKNDSLEDLLSYIRAYVMEYLSQNGIKAQIRISEVIPQRFVSGELRRNVFLTIKEALHNVVKHAHAREVQLHFDIHDKLEITIRDDGIGFDESKIRPFSNGLSNMRRRIEEIGGEFDLLHEHGTTIVMKIPLGK